MTRIFADYDVASIAAVPSVSNTAHVSNTLHATDDDHFDSVLASVAPAHEPDAAGSHPANPAPIPAPKIASAPIAKVPLHAHRARGGAKPAHADNVAQNDNDPALLPQDQPSKADAPVPAATAAPVTVPVAAPISFGGNGAPANEAGEPVATVAFQQEMAPANLATATGTSSNDTLPSNASSKSAAPGAGANNTQGRQSPQANAPWEIAAADHQATSQQSAPLQGTAVPSHVVDEIVAIAGTPAKQTSASPQVAANLANPQNLANLMTAARASVVMMPSPQAAAQDKVAIKPEPKSAPAQSSDTGKAALPSMATSKPASQPQRQDLADADVQDGKPGAHDARIAQMDMPAATSDKPVPSAPAPAAPVPQPVVASLNHIVAGTSAQVPAVRPDIAEASVAEPQPNVAAIAASIAAKSAAGAKTFEIRLDPPELGHVDVHLTVDNDGRVQATVMADRPHTLDLLQRGSHDLERALKDAGLNLSNNSLNFSLKGEGRQGDGGGASMARTRSLTSAVVARAEAANASEINLSTANGRLDIRV